jgi:hypothetical protein
MTGHRILLVKVIPRQARHSESDDQD